MSAIAEETNEVAPDLANLTVPMSEAAPDPNADYNAAPPCLPELFDENQRAVPYIADLMLDKEGIKREYYDEKKDGEKTGNKAVYYTAQVLAKVSGPADGREFDVRNFDTFVRPSGRYTTFVERGKQISPIGHLGKVAGFNLNDFPTVDELVPELAAVLSKRGENAVQAKVFIQWQWYSKNYEWTNAKGDAKKGKTLIYGMKNAPQLPNGSYSAKVIHKETGEELVAKAVIVKIEPLN